uniref:Uncharacterized protein n=1 Tax=Kalanchoe fedtschenkoi TaxID=63787 RepID=A0A7N0T3C5_KALFE
MRLASLKKLDTLTRHQKLSHIASCLQTVQGALVLRFFFVQFRKSLFPFLIKHLRFLSLSQKKNICEDQQHSPFCVFSILNGVCIYLISSFNLCNWLF